MKSVDVLIQVGQRYTCIRNVKSRANGREYYITGRTYVSEKDDCLTDEYGHVKHYWSTADKFDYHFRNVKHQRSRKIKEVLNIK
jgi:hypothetical protein